MKEFRTLAILEQKDLVEKLAANFDSLVIEAYDDELGYRAHIKAPMEFDEIFLVVTHIALDEERRGWKSGWDSGYDTAKENQIN